MLTDKCNAIIDEAITAGGDLTKLSAEAVAHIETCLECRKSLESIKTLKASAGSVIPVVAADAALKTKIASSLEGAMAARRAASASAASTKTLLGVGSVLLGIGLCGAIACGIICLDNKNGMAYKPVQDNSNKSRVEQVATSTVKTEVATYASVLVATATDSVATSAATVSTATIDVATVATSTENVQTEADVSKTEDDKDMRNLNASESEELINQTLPSVIEENGD